MLAFLYFAIIAYAVQILALCEACHLICHAIVARHKARKAAKRNARREARESEVTSPAEEEIVTGFG